jgi:two-component system chemotaxis sensor kinase CheA
MNSKKEKNIQAIRKIKEDIDTINFSDQGVWESIRIEIKAVAHDFPKTMSVPLKTLALCVEGVQALSEQKGAQSFSLIEAVSNALDAVEHYLLNHPGKKPAIQKAEQQLRQVLVKEQGESGKESAPGADPPTDLPTITLDDAAALLIQLEPDDLSGLAGLKESLKQIAGGTSYSQLGRDFIIRALEKIEGLIERRVSDTDLAMVETGELIEKAMDSIDEEHRQSSLTPSANSLPGNDGVPADDHRRPDDISPDHQTAPSAQDAVVGKEDKADDDGAELHYLPEDTDPELIAEYITEGADLIASAEESLLSLETDPDDMEAVGTVFRAFHTIKGTSAFMELTLISDLGHRAESLLSRVRDREIRYSGGYADLSLRALDTLKEMIVSVQNALEGNSLSKPEGYDDLMDLLADPEAAGISDEIDEVTPLRVGDVLVAQGKVDRKKVEEAAANHPDEKIGVAMVKSEAASVTDVGQALRTQKRMQSAGKVVESSVRVSTQRLDRLIDMVGEMVIAHSMVAQDAVMVNGTHHELAKKVAHTSKIVRELQDLSMSMRMVPLKATFNKMARLVRDLARKQGKHVDFITAGEDTEIDRNLVAIINDPLVHMVRNAVDHGIEIPQEREKAGKPPKGTVQLCAFHSAGSVVVEIKDDGKGLDREIILTKARKRGLVSQDSHPSDREVFNLIFEAGFSTAETVTDVSGRGVGLDVVKKNIESLRGQAEIRSEAGKGCVFKMSLPLTLAIIDGMVVRVGPETFVIPTVSIVRSIKPEPEDISTVYHQGEMLSLRDKLIPLFRLSTLYHIDGAEQNRNQDLIVVVEDEERQVGLFIDELVGRQQVVIKTLGETLKDIPGISGGAIMPNGRIGLILDVSGVVKLADEEHEEAATLV